MFSLFCCCVQHGNACRKGREIQQRARETLQVRHVAMSAFGKPPACATARLSDRPAVGIASNSVRYLTAAYLHANAGHRITSEASASRLAGLQSAIFCPDRRNCWTAHFLSQKSI